MCTITHSKACRREKQKTLERWWCMMAARKQAIRKAIFLLTKVNYKILSLFYQTLASYTERKKAQRIAEKGTVDLYKVLSVAQSTLRPHLTPQFRFKMSLHAWLQRCVCKLKAEAGRRALHRWRRHKHLSLWRFVQLSRFQGRSIRLEGARILRAWLFHAKRRKMLRRTALRIMLPRIRASLRISFQNWVRIVEHEPFQNNNSHHPQHHHNAPPVVHAAAAVHVTLYSARHLPHVDVFIELVYKDKTQKSTVKKYSLNPDWKPEETFEFDVSSGELSDIQIQLKDLSMASSKLLGTAVIGAHALKRLVAGDTFSDTFLSDEFLLTAPDGKPLNGKDKQQAHLVLKVAAVPAQVVKMNLQLNVDFQTAGREGSIQRQIFIKDLNQDLAHASGMGTSDFNILTVSPGCVVVDVDATEKAAQEIHRQSLDPNSRLRSGKVTRFTDEMTLSCVHPPDKVCKTITYPLDILAQRQQCPGVCHMWPSREVSACSPMLTFRQRIVQVLRKP